MPAKKKILVTYDSNNSGGSFWLKDEDWYALEKAGWKVAWVKDDKHKMRYEKKGSDRWLGALATSATKEFYTLADAIREWEKITKQDASDEGCNCCGPPHTFKTDEPYQYVSGEEIANILSGVESKSYRELVEEVARLRNKTIDS